MGKEFSAFKEMHKIRDCFSSFGERCVICDAWDYGDHPAAKTTAVMLRDGTTEQMERTKVPDSDLGTISQ